MQDKADNELARFFKDKRKDFSIINLIEEIYIDTKKSGLPDWEKWVNVGKGSFEFKLSCAFGGERFNILYREFGEESNTYNIYQSGDIESIIPTINDLKST